jgi:dienelactone hydrolase
VVCLAALLAGCATGSGGAAFPAEPKPGTVFHAFRKPEGAGPFPAVVLLHTCGGVWSGHMTLWSKRLVERGYAALVVDSFTPRGGSACNIPTYFPAMLDQVVDDALAALAYLRARSDIDGSRIAVAGFSYGASAALRTSSATYRRGIGGFKAAVAFYPMCVSPRADWPPAAQERANNLHDDIVAPTLVLMGAEDNDTPSVATNCAREVERLRRAGRPVAIEMYPGAGHVFDAGPSRHNAAATRATEDMFRFLDRELTGNK